jgi:hypothetical protein
VQLHTFERLEPSEGVGARLDASPTDDRSRGGRGGINRVLATAPLRGDRGPIMCRMDRGGYVCCMVNWIPHHEALVVAEQYVTERAPKTFTTLLLY